jgi:hypothetical protein
MKKKIFSALFLATISLLMIICAPSCSAIKGEGFPMTSDAKKIAKKSYYHALYNCYTLTNGKDMTGTIWGNQPKNANGRINSDGDGQKPAQYEHAEDEGQIDRDIETQANTIRDGMTTFLTYRSLFPNFTASNKVLFPNGLTAAASVGNATNCSDFYNGSTWQGAIRDNNNMSQIYPRGASETGFSDNLMARLGKPSLAFENTASSSTIDSFMRGMGYQLKDKITTTTAGETFVKVHFRTGVRVVTMRSDGSLGGESNYCVRTNTYQYYKDSDGVWMFDSGSYSLEPTASDPTLGTYLGKCEKATNNADFKKPGEYSDATFPMLYLKFGGGESFYMYLGCTNKDEDGNEQVNCVDNGKTWSGSSGKTINGNKGDSGDLAAGVGEKLVATPESSPLYEIKNSDGTKYQFYFVGTPNVYAQESSTNSNASGGYNYWKLAYGGKDNGYVSNVNVYTRKYLADGAIKYLGGTSRSAQKLTKAEEAVLYQYYLLQRGAIVSCDGEIDLSDIQTQDVKWSNTADKRPTCKIGYVSESAEKANIAIDERAESGSQDGYFGKSVNMQAVIDEANKIEIDDSFNKVPQATYDTVASSESQYDRAASPSNDGDGSATGATKQDCYSGAGSLGWVVCPIVYDVSSFIKDKYNTWVMPALQINTTLFGSSGNNNTYIAWNIFRNIANVAFVIVFLIVIFSQLTGVGLDNYGIKKVLPKLIIGAILINCSYIICQLAIDVANILGYGIAGIFKSITNNIGVPKIISVEGVNVSSDSQDVGALANGAGLQMVVALIVGVITTAAVLSQGTAIIIPVLLAVLGVAISLFTLIAILAMRQAAAVLLVVASPLAFVAYMLPNTKKLFSMWLKAIQGVLLAFPACSALIYGGDMVGHILISTSNGSTWVLISAAIVSVAPVFFIPKLIRGSMGAIANVTSNLGRGVSKGSQRFINSTQAAKNIRDNSEAARKYRSIMRRSGLTRDENGNLVDRWSRRRGPVRWASDRLHQGAEAYKSRVKRIPIIGDALARPVEQHQMNRDAVRNQAAEEAIAYGRAGSTYGDTGLSQLNSRVYDAKGKQEDAYVSGVERQIKLNAMTMLDGKTQIDPSKLEDLKKGLQEAIEAGNDRRIKAFANVLSAKGEHGRDMVRAAIQDAAPTPNSAEGKKTLASHIMDNFTPAYKENSRSTYDWLNDANRNGVSAAGSIRDRVPDVGSLKESSLLNMDDREFERLNTGLLSNSISISSAQKAQLLAMIDKALTSEAASSAKLNRKADLDTLRTKLRS